MGGGAVLSGFFPSWNKFTIDYTQVVAAAGATTSCLLPVMTLPAAGVLNGVIAVASVGFSNIGTCSMTCGISGTPAKYILTSNIKSTTPSLNTAAIFLESMSTSTSVITQITSSGGNLDQLNQGVLDIYFLMGIMPV